VTTKENITNSARFATTMIQHTENNVTDLFALALNLVVVGGMENAVTEHE